MCSHRQNVSERQVNNKTNTFSFSHYTHFTRVESGATQEIGVVNLMFYVDNESGFVVYVIHAIQSPRKLGDIQPFRLFLFG